MARSIALTWHSADDQDTMPMGTYPAHVDRLITQSHCTEEMMQCCADDQEREDYLAGYYTWTEVA